MTEVLYLICGETLDSDCFTWEFDDGIVFADREKAQAYANQRSAETDFTFFVKEVRYVD